MPLTKAFLVELGVEPETATTIMTEHGKMQTKYLGQIDESQKALADRIAVYDAQIAQLNVEKTELENNYKGQLSKMQFDVKSSSLLDSVKTFDKSLLMSLIKVDDLDPNSDSFDKTFNERLEVVKTERPYLFEPDKQDDQPPTPPVNEQRRGFVPGQQGQDTPPVSTFTRVGGEYMPDITNIVKFD